MRRMASAYLPIKECAGIFVAVRRRAGGPSRVLGQFQIACLAVMAISGAVPAQTVRVDITPGHEVNSVVPNQALGAGIDRLPKGAVDKLLAEPILTKILSAG